MVREGKESYLQTSGLGRDVEAFAWKLTAWLEAVKGHHSVLPMKNCGGKV